MIKRHLTIVILAYTFIAAVMTWPLLPNATSKIAWDLTDPIFNCWVLAWTAGQVLAFLKGDFGALGNFWNGNIFYPDTLTLAYSEHLTPQMLQILPLYALTGNILLCYNLLFLSTFVLSGVSVYLLVRDITRSDVAGFVGGLAFAYAPYRIAQGSHLQVLSTFWMALALFGLRRFFMNGSWRSLVGASTSILLQNLSCGYYMFFGAPLYVAYSLHQMARQRLLRQGWIWRRLLLAAAVVALLTWPFIRPYITLRDEGRATRRSYQELVEFSADTHSFATAPAMSWLWGIHGKRLLAFPKAEGEGFLGFTILALGITGIALRLTHLRLPTASMKRGRTAVETALLLLLAVGVIGLVVLLVNGRPPALLGHVVGYTTNVYFGIIAVLAGALIIVSRRGSQVVAQLCRSQTAFFLFALMATALLALGPEIRSAGQTIGTGPYWFLYRWIPGFDGLRVPARFLMLSALCCSVLAGLGIASVVARWPRRGIVLAFVAAALILIEGWAGPLPMNIRLWAHGYEQPPRTVYTGQNISPVYEFLRTTSSHVILIEFPFGEPVFDIRSAFYAGYHRRPLVNGYSGYFPVWYDREKQALGYVPTDLNAATAALRRSGATFALVHEDAFLRGGGHDISAWLVSLGGSMVVSAGGDKLFQLPPSSR